MREGLHVIQRDSLGALEPQGVRLPRPWTGLLDGLRTLEGHLAEPPEGEPFVLTGLTTLLRAGPEEATPVLQMVRQGLVDGRQYFSWKRIPVVLVLDGTVLDREDGQGLELEAGGRTWALAPLLGTRMKRAHPRATGWWWSPQIS